MPFDEIAPMVGRTAEATRQLASRARRRVAGAPVPPRSRDRARERETVNAFMLAAHRGDLAALAEVLDPDVVLRSDWGTRPGDAPVVVRGAESVMRLPNVFGHDGTSTIAVRVDEEAGTLVLRYGSPFALMRFSVVDGRIVAIDTIAQVERVRQLTASIAGSGPTAQGIRQRPCPSPNDGGRDLDH